MHLKIINKSNKHKAGVITSKKFEFGLKMDIQYQANLEFFIDLQKLLLKYYDIKAFSGAGGMSKRFWLPEIRKTLETKNQHRRIRDSQKSEKVK